MTSSGTGRAPEFRRSDSCFADCVVKFPSMIPLPDVKIALIVGAEISLPSSRICTGCW